MNPATRRRRLTTLTTWACWGYAAAALGAWLLLLGAGDRWWPATLLTFGPRWVLLLPLAALLPAAACLNRRLVAPLAAGLGVVLGPVMGFNLALPRGDCPGPSVRVLTCNLGGVGFRAEALGLLLDASLPDLAAFQEWPGESAEAVLRARGWAWRRGACGLCLASRGAFRRVEQLDEVFLGGPGAVERFEAATPVGPVTVFNLHLATPREGLEAVLRNPWHGGVVLQDNIDLRRHESEVAAAGVSGVSGPVLVAGDFNLTPDSAIFRRHWAA